MQERTHRSLVRLERFEAPHQHVEQPLARRLLGHLVVGGGEHGAIDRFCLRGQNCERGRELRAQIGERDFSAACDLAESDLFEALLAQQRHEGIDHPCTRALSGGGLGRAVASGFARHRTLLDRCRPQPF